MSWTSAHSLRVVVLLALVAIGAWLLHYTEWVHEPQSLPLQEPMRSDGTHAARLLLQKLGVASQTAKDLRTLPPSNATLVLATPFWNLLVGGEDRLRRWVESGGHLVVDSHVIDEPPQGGWWPLVALPRGRDERDAGRDWCRVLHQDQALPPAFGDRRGFVLCAPAPAQELLRHKNPLWLLHSDEHGLEVQRVALGAGRITGLSGSFGFEWQTNPWVDDEGAAHGVHNFSNRGLAAGDNAALLAALVDAKPGQTVWFVSRVERPPLPLWLWQVAAPTLVLLGCVLALLLWRAGTRLGPLRAEPPARRRSIAAQVQGLADFLFRHQPAALHSAALRALREAAARRIPGWARLTPAARTLALAKATGLPVAALEQAQEPVFARNPAAWSDTLALLETARRALQHHPTSVRSP
jgi:Domain of unknown function (DUF4350)